MSSRIKTALVTGANGFVGVHIVEELLRRGVEVLALKRSASSISYLKDLPVRLIALPEFSSDLLADVVPPNLDAVFHVAGDASFWSGHRARQLEANVTLTKALLEVAQRKEARAFVFTSTAGALGLQSGVLTEESPVTAATSRVQYVRTKWLAEEAVRRAQAGGLNTVIFNPGTTIGPRNDRYWGRVFDMVRRGKLRVVPPGQTSFCDVAQVAYAHVEAVERQAFGERFLLGGADAPFRDAIQIASRLCGRDEVVREAPRWAIRLLGVLGELGALVTRREPLMTREGAEYLLHRNRVSSRKAIDRLGYQPQPLDVMLERTYRWFRDR